jgi:hypothetical protein
MDIDYGRYLLWLTERSHLGALGHVHAIGRR